MAKITDEKNTENLKIAVAKLKFFRVSCRKTRPLLSSLKGKNANEVLAYLKFSNNRISNYLYKLFYSCLSTKDPIYPDNFAI